jgi:hypothetical protein
METRKSSRALFGILVLSAWVLGSVTEGLVMRIAFYVFENGEDPVH